MSAASIVAVLFVQPGGEYYNRTQVDLWPESHDAKRYTGPYPVVAHPPCNRWCTLAAFVQQQHPNKPHLRVGADGGTFKSALAAVRRWGGVLEHPAYSRAWPAHKLVRPKPGGGWTRAGEREWVCEVSQAAYGHRGRKLTWLLYVGRHAPPALDWSRPATNVMVAAMGNRKRAEPALKVMGKKEANATPRRFADALIELARHSRSSQRKCAI